MMGEIKTIEIHYEDKDSDQKLLQSFVDALWEEDDGIAIAGTVFTSEELTRLADLIDSLID